MKKLKKIKPTEKTRKIKVSQIRGEILIVLGILIVILIGLDVFGTVRESQQTDRTTAESVVFVFFSVFLGPIVYLGYLGWVIFMSGGFILIEIGVFEIIKFKRDEATKSPKMNKICVAALILDFLYPLVGVGLGIIGLVSAIKRNEDGELLAKIAIVIGSIPSFVRLSRLIISVIIEKAMVG